MNAPLPPEAVAVATLPVTAIAPSPSNPRKHFDKAYIAELAASIKAHGLIQPITVRPLPLDRHFEFNRKNVAAADHPAYELVVGECRWRAAKLAGLTEVPGFWRELDDKQVLEIQVIENLQRRDVHPIEEAEGYEQLMQRHAYKAEEIAAKIGKSKGYVYARLKLTALCPEAREAFFAGKLDASTALLIARIPGATLQKKALAKITNGYDGQPLSYRNAIFEIRNNFTISLTQATFSPDDAELVPSAGSCTDCPKRSGNAPELCADLNAEDVCTDTACFEDKRQARRQQLISTAETKGITIFSGDKAREIAPHGLYSLDTSKYVCLDHPVAGDPEERTYRDILGDDAPVAAMIEDSRKALVDLGEPKALAAALRKAGWQPDLLVSDKQAEETARSKQENAEREARIAARKAEMERRLQLKEDIFARIPALATSGNDSAIDYTNLKRLVRIYLIGQFRRETEYGDLETEYLKRYDYPLPTPCDVDEELPKIAAVMQDWPLAKLLTFMFEYLMYDDVRPELDWEPGKPLPPTLAALAEFSGTDPTPAAQAHEEGAAEPAAPAKPKGKKAAAQKTETKADPAPALPANEPAAPVKTKVIADWPFPAATEAA